MPRPKNRLFHRTFPHPSSAEGSQILSLIEKMPVHLAEIQGQWTNLWKSDEDEVLLTGKDFFHRKLRTKILKYSPDTIMSAESYPEKCQAFIQTTRTLENSLNAIINNWCKKPFISRKKPVEEFIRKINAAPESHQFIRALTNTLKLIYDNDPSPQKNYFPLKYKLFPLVSKISVHQRSSQRLRP